MIVGTTVRQHVEERKRIKPTVIALSYQCKDSAHLR
jgi:hypothetical protein